MAEPEGQAQQNIHPELHPPSAVSAVQPMGILEVGLIIIYAFASCFASSGTDFEILLCVIYISFQ